MEKYIEFKDISKAYTGVQALKEISFKASSGEVCALVGENGAGKSTLLKILSGYEHADSGTINFNGENVRFESPIDAINKGISVIYQDRYLIPSLSVAENIFMEQLPSKMGIINFSYANKEAQKIIDFFGLSIRTNEKISNLSIAHQQMVEIMKCYRRNSDLIAFDEPTASLSDKEIDKLFKIIKLLKEEGKIIIYVSHRLKELYIISDKIIILKDGKLVTEVATEGTKEDQVIRYMVGRNISDVFSNLSRNEEIGEVILEVKNLNNKNIHDISFKLHEGEIIGFAGLVESGRTEIMKAIFGVDPLDSGEIFIEGKKVSIRSPGDAIELGIGLCPEDRKEEGLILESSIKKNITVPILNKISRYGILNSRKEKAIATEAVEKYNVKTDSIEKIVAELSGGNQQKVIVARWLSSDPKILILDEATKGIDVGAKAEIYQMICDLAKKGIGIIFISSELVEVLNLTDRIFVIKLGKISGILQREEATEEKALSLAMIK